MRYAIAIICLLALTLSVGAVLNAQEVVLRDAPQLKFPSATDSNSPCHWDGDTLYLFNSVGRPIRSTGKDQFSLADPKPAEYDNKINGARWIECTWRNDDGVLYGWYHNEPGGICPGTHLTAPRIGAVRSTDNGAHWTDLGLVLEARPNAIECRAKNGYFAGGNGDFSCMLDKDKTYLYLFISTYSGDVTEQGVSVARMLWKDRDKPVGKVFKYYERKWDEPGVGGRVSPIFPGKIDWKRSNADAFWGPSIHWNTYLEQYVALLNRTSYKPGWPQEGVYISYNKTLSPDGWSEPKKILDKGSWYPEAIGVNAKAKETDKLCGKQARFYMHGASAKEIIFFKEGEDTTKLPPVFEPKKEKAPAGGQK
jgi:hypothetical protein